MVSFTHKQKIFCSQTQLDDISHEKTNICWQLFAGHVLGSRPIKRNKNLHRMIIVYALRVNKSFPWTLSVIQTLESFVSAM